MMFVPYLIQLVFRVLSQEMEDVGAVFLLHHQGFSVNILLIPEEQPDEEAVDHAAIRKRRGWM